MDQFLTFEQESKDKWKEDHRNLCKVIWLFLTANKDPMQKFDKWKEIKKDEY